MAFIRNISLPFSDFECVCRCLHLRTQKKTKFWLIFFISTENHNLHLYFPLYLKPSHKKYSFMVLEISWALFFLNPNFACVCVFTLVLNRFAKDFSVWWRTKFLLCSSIPLLFHIHNILLNELLCFIFPSKGLLCYLYHSLSIYFVYFQSFLLN